MNKKSFVIFISTIIISFTIGIFYFSSKQTYIGKAVDSYKNVPVYYNGLLFTDTFGENYSNNGYYYGYKWQCVEFVKRFYYDSKNHKMPDLYGNAKDFIDSNLKQGELNKSRGLVQYYNGGDTKPKVDDLLVFTDSEYGHVAIITKVSDNYIEVIQQNVLGYPRQKFSLTEKNGDYFIGDDKTPAGWLRKE